MLSLPVSEVCAISRHSIHDYFCHYACYLPDAPLKCYAVRIGSKTLFAEDTMELRKMFGRMIGDLKRRAHA